MDGWDSLLSALPGLGGYGVFGAVVIIAVRMVIKADARYNAEVDAHEDTQKALDDERARRRKAEDDLSEVKTEVRELKLQVAKLERRIVEP